MSERTDEELYEIATGARDRFERWRRLYNLGLSDAEAAHAAEVEGLRARIAEAGGIRPIVLWFARQMEQKLRENDHKGGWHQDATHKLMARVCDELAECVDNMKPGDAAVDTFRFASHCLRSAGSALRQFGPYLPVAANGRSFIAEAADVANMAMMVADHFRDGGPCEDSGLATLSANPETTRKNDDG